VVEEVIPVVAQSRDRVVEKKMGEGILEGINS